MLKAYELDCKQKCLQAGHPSLRRDSSLFSCCPNFCSYAELMEVALMRTLSVLATGACRFTYSHCSNREIKHRVYSKQQTANVNLYHMAKFSIYLIYCYCSL